MGIGEIRELFDSMRLEEVDTARYLFSSGGRKMLKRRSSTLRTANRRISDSEMMYLAEESAKTFFTMGGWLQY